jgi:Cu(I)/Ag(I) efflux system periplasmic protein CusF
MTPSAFFATAAHVSTPDRAALATPIVSSSPNPAMRPGARAIPQIAAGDRSAIHVQCYDPIRRSLHMHNLFAIAIAFVLAALATPLHAQHNHGSMSSTPAASTPAASALSEGEVRRIDKAGGTITLKHGPLANVDMPPMTMSFTVKDRAAIDKVKVGDKVRFRVEKEGTDYVVTRLEK